MKQVFKVYINGKFSQYLMRSETRLISQLFETGKKITLECVELSADQYNVIFGKETDEQYRKRNSISSVSGVGIQKP